MKRPSRTSPQGGDQPGEPAKSSKFPLRIEQLDTARKSGTGALPVGSPRGGTAPAVGAKQRVLRPQTPLSHAFEHAQRVEPPSGVGLESQHFRRRMVERLRQAGLDDPRVAEALMAVPRHLFLDSALVNQAYEDTSLPIGLEQTISKPSVVARMIELLCRRPVVTAGIGRPLGRVLEIGSGCGYQAAVLSCLASQVYSVERLRPLYERARASLAQVTQETGRRMEIRLIYGDGRLGHAPNAPYDCIIAAAGADQLPQAWLDQLAPAGRLVAPMESERRGAQVLLVADRTPEGELVYAQHEAVQFVPLKSGTS